MELRGAPAGPEIKGDDAGKILNAVLDEGINLIDTSIDYGRCEELIGRYIAHRRSEYFLASKCGCVPGAGTAAGHIHTAENIRAGVEHSLRLMKTDHLDAVQFHRSITRREFEEHGALDAALKLKREARCVSSAFQGHSRISTSRSAWASSMCFRFRIRRCSGTMKMRLRARRRQVRGSSFAAASLVAHRATGIPAVTI